MSRSGLDLWSGARRLSGMMRLTVLALCLAGTASAECPPAPDIIDAESALLEQVQAAGNEFQARPHSLGLWQLWTTAPDETAQALLDRGMDARASWDFLAATEAFDRLVEYCPNYAEGYNQRAFVNFLREDYAAALVDLDRAIELSPRHVGAISGKGLTLIGMDRVDEAQVVLREAVTLNPWLSERHLLIEPPGEKL